MKRRFSFLWVAFAILAAVSGCSPYIEPSRTPTSALVKVECQNASQRQIMELLRLGRARDITVTPDGSCITAAFSPDDTTPERLAQILQNLHDLSGVLHVEVVENPRPILRNF